jgi:N-acetylneuraminic acid mutarotase
VLNGKFYLAGGTNSVGSPTTGLNVYDPVNNTWTPRAPMPTARSFLAAGVANGIVYAVGGVTGTTAVATVEAYNPGTNSWTARAPLPQGVSRPAGVGAINGVLYLAGGIHFATLNTLYAYTPSTNSTARSFLSGGAINGRVYAMAGVAGSGNTNQAYIP